jgi:hypothetical protein
MCVYTGRDTTRVRAQRVLAVTCVRVRINEKYTCVYTGRDTIRVRAGGGVGSRRAAASGLNRLASIQVLLPKFARSLR